MDRGYRIESRNSEGNLHVSLYGTFNGMCAWELFKIVRRRQSEPGRIFVGTCGLDEVKEAGADMFKSGMKTVKTRKDWLYFKGKKGFEIAPDGSRVLLCEKQGKRSKPFSGKLPGLFFMSKA